MSIERIAETYLTFETPFGKIIVEPGDLYNVGERNDLEEITRRRFANGIYTTALLELQVANSDTGFVDPGDENP